MTTIDEFAFQFLTDKRSDCHNYTPYYEELFGHLRDKECSILEFGIKTGASIRMWEEAFPKAKIVCADIRPAYEHRPKRAIAYVLNAASPQAVEQMCAKEGPFDFIIDDSAHTIPVAKNIIEVCFPKHLKPGGWLVIEDVNSGYKRDLKPEQQHDLIHFCKDYVLAVNHHGNLCKCGPKFWDRSTEFDKALERIVYFPGLMCMRKRP